MNKYLFLLIMMLFYQVIFAETNQERCDKFYDMTNIVYIEITMLDEDNDGINDWIELKNDTKDDNAVPPKDYLWFKAAKVKAWGDHWPTNNGVTNVGITKKGGVGSNDPNKTAFKIDFGKLNNANNDVADAQIGTHFLTLNNAKQDETFMRQCLQNYICKQASMPFSRCNLAHVWVNGGYQGIYINVESMEKRAIQNNFGNNDKGNLYEFGYWKDFKGNNPYDWKGWSSYPNVDFTTAGSHIYPNKPSNITNVFDLVGYQKFLGMEILLKHWDGYNNMVNNAYVYNDVVTPKANPVPGNKSDINFKFIMSGTDQILQTSKNWTRFTSSVLADLTNADPNSKFSSNAEILNLLNTVFDPNIYYSVLDPYLNNISAVLKTMKEYQATIPFSEYFYPNWSYDPTFLKNQLKQAYTSGYQTLLNMTPPADRNINSTPVWIEDNVPGNGIVRGNEPWAWVWAPYSGQKSHKSQTMSGMHQHYFDSDYSVPMIVKIGAELYTYIYLDPTNPPTEVMLQWNYGGHWTQAYWGNDNIAWNPRKYMGVLPKTGVWTRLSVPASSIEMENKIVYGMSFTLFNGKATWDCSGVFNPAINAWIEDQLPGNATDNPVGNERWTWVTTPIYSGSMAHQSQNMAGIHQHFFDNNTSTPMFVRAGSELYTFIYIDPTNPPSEVMLQWNYGGQWTQAYWGNDNISWNPRKYMGPLPVAGTWAKLTVPASSVALENKTIYGMAFTLYGGKATWDASGVK